MKARGIFLGLTTVDILQYVDYFPGKDEKIRANTQKVYGGGPATNAAVTFSLLGGQATLVSNLGHHPLASLVRSDLDDTFVEHIELAGKYDGVPVLSAITVDTTCGDRSVVYGGGNYPVPLWKKGFEDHISEADILMIDGFLPDLALKAAKVARKNSIPVVLDGGSWKRGLEDILEYVDYAICSAKFRWPGEESSLTTVAKLRQKGVAFVAISRGELSLLVECDDFSGEVMVNPAKVVDTLGAGDILHGAFCKFVLNTGRVEALAAASAVASHSCTVQGTRDWSCHFSKK